MLQMTKAQKATLGKMDCLYVVTQLTTGALVVVFELVCQTWMVVETDGNISSFSNHLSFLKQCL